MENPPGLRIGLVGIGLDTYWPQFPGLKKRLEGYTARIETKIANQACAQNGTHAPTGRVGEGPHLLGSIRCSCQNGGSGL